MKNYDEFITFEIKTIQFRFGSISVFIKKILQNLGLQTRRAIFAFYTWTNETFHINSHL